MIKYNVVCIMKFIKDLNITQRWRNIELVLHDFLNWNTNIIISLAFILRPWEHSELSTIRYLVLRSLNYITNPLGLSLQTERPLDIPSSIAASFIGCSRESWMSVREQCNQFKIGNFSNIWKMQIWNENVHKEDEILFF